MLRRIQKENAPLSDLALPWGLGHFVGMAYFYISNPYNGTSAQKEERARVAAVVCGILLKRGIHAWSPIVHNHAMMKVFDRFTLEERRSTILEFDFTLLRSAKGMIVLTIDGWNSSHGVRAELDLCKKLSIPVHYLDPKELLEGKDPALCMRPTPEKTEMQLMH
jgi:hypothetical protein